MISLLAVVLGILILPSEQALQPECHDKKVDLLFCLDESGSIRESQWSDIKNFVKSIVKRSHIGEDHIQVAVMSFGSNTRFHFDLNTYKSKHEILTAIDGLKKTPIEGETYTHTALNKFKDLLYGRAHGGRNDALKMAILVMDGVSKYIDKAKASALAVHKAGIKIAVVGVGNTVNAEDLKNLASDPDSKYLFAASEFNDLRQLSKPVAEVTCAGFNAYSICPASGSERCCPADMYSFDGSCYFFGTLLLVDWNTAKAACEAMHANLVEIDSYQEDEFLVKTLTDMKTSATGYYTGFHFKSTVHQWGWTTTDKSEYIPNRWYGSYPYSNRAYYGHCMIMHKSYRPWKWLQTKCLKKNGFICES